MWLRRARERRTLNLEEKERCHIWKGRTLSKEDAVQSGKEKTLFEGQKDADQA